MNLYIKPEKKYYYPKLPVGVHHTPWETYDSPTSRNGWPNDFFVGGITYIEGNFEVSEARIFVGTPTLTPNSKGIVGIYSYDLPTDSWNLLDYTVEYDISVLGQQIVGFNTGTIKLENNFYSIGVINQETCSFYANRVQANRTHFGYGGNIISSHQSCLQFNHVYNGSLPANIINTNVLGGGIGAFYPMVYLK